MSNENRDYPAWLDEELFSSLNDAPAPEEPIAPAAETEAPKKKAKAPAEEPEAKKSPKKKSGKSADKAGEKKPAAKKGEKSSDKAGGKKPKTKKGDKAAADEPKKKKKQPVEAEAAPAAADGAAPAFPDPNAGLLPEEGQAAEAPKKEKKKDKKSGKAARGLLIGLLGVFALVLLACIGVVVCAYLVSNSNTNMPNVCLGELNVGGLTQEETLQTLADTGWVEARGGTLKVSLPQDVSFELDYLRAGACQSAEEAAEAAFSYGHGEDKFENLKTYIHCMMNPVDLSRNEFIIDRAYVSEAVDKAVEEFEKRTDGKEFTINEEDSTLEFVKGVGQLSLDRDAICDMACKALLAGEHEIEWSEITGELRMPDFAALADELAREAVNARYDSEKDEFIPESKGAALDAEKAQELWEKAELLEKVVVPITLIEPEITVENLKEVLFHDKLGACTTPLWGSTANRISNVRLACSRFNDMVLQPGESFSYNEVVGERTPEAGFKIAPTYSGTAHIDGYGGGICQVSSTLYNAVQYANLKVNERVCHTMLVGYLAAGLDATVDWPDTNFVFTNNRDYPVRIKAGVDESGRALTIEIWGTDVDGSYVDMLHYEWPAYDDYYRSEYGIDVQVGYGARTIRRTYHADGSYTDEDNVYSYYHIPDDEINWPVIETYDDEGEDYAEEG